MNIHIRSLFLGLSLLVGALILTQPVSAATTFYRGFALGSTEQFNAGGYRPTNAIIISGKKRAIKKEFADLLTDLGGMYQTFVPRDASMRNVVYLSTNHLRGLGNGQKGVFLVWKYNFDTGAYSRVFSLQYNPTDTPMGYSILGNEGAKLIVLKNIDGPYCERDTANLSSAFLKTLDLRNLAKGLQGYTPSQSMQAIFRALPECGWVDRTPPVPPSAPNAVLSTNVHVLEHSRASTRMTIEANLSGMPTSMTSLEGTQLMIFENASGTVPHLSEGVFNTALKTCIGVSSCSVERETNTVYSDISYYTTLSYSATGQIILTSPIRSVRDAN